MTPSEIAETLINGNITVAREAIAGGPHRNVQRDAAIRTLDVLLEASDMTVADRESVARLRRCLTGGT